jgi:putative flippase GtrA
MTALTDTLFKSNNSQKIRYLLAGGWNTLFGYLVGVGLYQILHAHTQTLYIALLANTICISMSFLTYKLFVFRTSGRWLEEYLKSWTVYSGAALISSLLLWVFVDLLSISIYIAQALVIISTVVISYTGHSRFTFKKRGCTHGS